MNIPSEAVEVAAKALHSYEDHRESWDTSDNDVREYYLDQARAVLKLAGPFISARALHDAANEAEGIISRGDNAEVAAPVPGENGRGDAVFNRDVLYEEPAAWLREYADSLANRDAA